MLTLPENAFTLDTEIVVVPVWPRLMVRLLGLEEMPKSHVRETETGIVVDTLKLCANG